jgi:hypothetical protein
MDAVRQAAFLDDNTMSSATAFRRPGPYSPTSINLTAFQGDVGDGLNAFPGEMVTMSVVTSAAVILPNRHGFRDFGT